MNVSTVAQAVEPFVRRRRIRDTIRGGWLGAWVGAVLFALSVLGGRFLAFPTAAVGIIGAALSVSVGAWVGARRSPSPLVVCSLLDADFCLMERLRTAFETEARGDMSPLATLQRQDALARLETITPQMWIPRPLPRAAGTVLFAYGLASLLWFLPSRAGEPIPLNASERAAIRRAAEALGRSPSSSLLQPSLRELASAKSIGDALMTLADAEARLRAVSPATDALATTRELARKGVNAPSLADALAAASPNLPPALREELAALRDRLARNATTEPLIAALEGIETRPVTAETLARIVAALRELEKQSDADLLATLETLREQKQAIAAVALESRRHGATARLDATPGKESDDTETTGKRLTPKLHSPGANVLALDAALSSLGEETRVYSVRNTPPPRNRSPLIPFREVVLASRQEAERAVGDESLPLAYRTRIAAYFTALTRATRPESSREE